MTSPWRGTGIMIAAVLLAGCGGDGKPKAAEPRTLTGTVTLFDADRPWRKGPPCEGRGGYSDLHAGVQVTVRDEAKATVGVASLGDGEFEDVGHCRWAFSVPGLPEREFYSVEVSRRGEVTFSRADLVQRQWMVALTIGD
jgi:hypothetical protein